MVFGKGTENRTGELVKQHGGSRVLIHYGGHSDLYRAKFAIMHPELTMTLPDWQTQSGCTDIMMHTMERYFTQSGSPEITNALAEALRQWKTFTTASGYPSSCGS